MTTPSRYCRACGAPLTGTRYCNGCGASLVDQRGSTIVRAARPRRRRSRLRLALRRVGVAFRRRPARRQGVS